MSTRSFFSRCPFHFLFLAVTLAMLGAGTVRAETLLYEIIFKGEDGSTPRDWQKAGAPEDADQFTIRKGVYRADAGKDFVASWFSGNDLKGQPSDTWTDYTVKGVVRLSGEAMTGVLARFKSPTEFYHARIKGTGAKATFELYRIGGMNGSVALQDPAQINYPPGESWRIELTVAGTNISAKLFDTKGELIASLSGTDSLYKSGTAGVRVFSRNFAAVVESLTVTAP